MSQLNILQPPQTKGHVSVVKLPDHWFIACTSEELKRKPLAATVQGVPLVLFRERGGRVAALLDRCPHRNVPLSVGKVRQGRLECAYHGWQFDSAGTCRTVPGLCGDAEASARNCPSYATRELDGFVWVYSTADKQPDKEPFRFPFVDDSRYTTVRRSLSMQCTMHAAVENALDVPHTGFLHGGLFRTSKKSNEITVKIKRGPDRVEAEYEGEPAPRGLAGRVLAPGGGMVQHWDRFILPCVAQVEYQLGSRYHVMVSSAFTPVTDFETRMHAAVCIRLPVSGRLIKPVMMPVALRIFQQDSQILKLQTALIRRFGGEQFVHTEIDVLGPHIWHLLRQAERGVRGDTEGSILERRMMT